MNASSRPSTPLSGTLSDVPSGRLIEIRFPRFGKVGTGTDLGRKASQRRPRNMSASGMSHIHEDRLFSTVGVYAATGGVVVLRTAKGAGSLENASLNPDGKAERRFAVSLRRNSERPVAVIPSSRTREPMKPSTDCTAKAMMLAAPAARRPDS